MFKNKSEENKAIIVQFTQAHNQKDLATLQKFIAPNFLSHISDHPRPLNRSQYLEGIKRAHQAFSELTFAIEDLISNDEKVAIRLIARGRHTGLYQGFPPTNKQVEFIGFSIRRIQDGQIVEEWQANDQLSLLRQIGSFI